MMKKILSLLLTLVIVIGMVPTMVFADDEHPTRVETPDDDPSGMHITKFVETTDDGYFLTMESYATGTSRVSTIGLDILLVLDVSGSMGNKITYYTFTARSSQGYSYNNANGGYYYLYNGEYYAVNREQSQGSNKTYALSFTDSNGTKHYLSGTGITETRPTNVNRQGSTIYTGVLYSRNTSYSTDTKIEMLRNSANGFVDIVASYVAEGADHKIAMIKYAGNKSTTVGNDMYWSGLNQYNYTQVVNGLTDVNAAGAAALHASINGLEAGGATSLDYALELAADIRPDVVEDRRQIMVIFTDGEPNHGTGFNTTVANTSIGYTKDFKEAGVFVYTVATLEDPSEQMANFLSYLSSNYPHAEDMDTPGTHDSNSYSTIVSTDEALDSIFENIAREAVTSASNADEDAVLTDTLTNTFDFGSLDAVGNITGYEVYTMDCTGEGTWGNKTDVSDTVTVSVSGKDINVSGFDYTDDDNIVVEKQDGWQGKKICVRFEIKVSEDAELEEGLAYYPTNTVAFVDENGEELIVLDRSPQLPLLTYRVTYNAGDHGKVGDNKDSVSGVYLIGWRFPTAPSVTPDEGWEFDGWVDENGNKVTEFPARVTENHTYTATYKSVKISVDVQKVWDDNNDQDGVRPTEVTVQLKADGENCGDPQKLDASNNWSYTFPDLDKMSEDGQIVYTVVETTVEGYETEYSVGSTGSLVVTNKHTPATKDVTAVKVWDDDDNRDGVRPDHVTLQLKANGENCGDSVNVSAADNWTKTWPSLPEKANGREIAYTVVETTVDGYETEYSVNNDGTLVVTNKHTPATTSVTAVKVWDDDSNRDGVRPGFVTLQLKANGEDCGEAVPVNANDNWMKTWSGLLKYENGEEIVYTVVETAVDGYQTEYSVRDDGTLVVTNTHENETTSVTAVKVWDDDNNRDGERPNHVTLQLKANGEDCGEAVPVSASDNWTKTWSGLLKNENGEEIVYTVVETAVNGYSTEYSVDNSGRLVVTNIHTPGVVSFTAVKIWDDDNDRDGVRPEYVEFQLKADGENYGEPVRVTENDNWMKTWSDLPEKSNGQTVIYTVVETAVDGYETSYALNDNGIYEVTNKHTLETTSITAVKVWDDDDNRDGVRPDHVTLQLKANGEDCGEAVPVSANDNWTKTWSDLLKNENGEQIVYTVVETAVDGYETEYSIREDGTLVVTNTHENETTSVTAVKVWDDDNNRDGVRPDHVTLQLKANGEDCGEAVPVTENDNWMNTWSDLLKKENGEEIVYTVVETAVDGYETEYSVREDGVLVVTNKHQNETTSVTAVKVWDDDDNRDGVRPDHVTLQLKANGEDCGEAVPVSASDDWTKTWSDLLKNENGEEIVYTVVETAVDGYETEYSVREDGTLVVTNTHENETTSVTAVKVWDDDGNRDGVRPDHVTLQLKANGENCGEAVPVTENDNWMNTWSDLLKNEEGEEIVYTVVETAVDGYETEYSVRDDGTLVVTNKHENETTSVTAVKVWDDDDNRDGVRPDHVTLQLKANGEDCGEAVPVNANDNWTKTWSDLLKNENGEEIVYTVVETDVRGYETEYSVREDGTLVVTNKHDNETTSVKATKIWDDDDNRDGVRPDFIMLQLKANGENSGEPVRVTADDNWTKTWSGMLVFEDGEEIVYTVVETAVDGYETSYSLNENLGTLEVINKHDPALTSVTAVKVWDDDDNRDGVRPDHVTLQLKANGEDCGEAVPVSANDDWTKTWSDLLKNDNGEEIVYTVVETAVDGYVAEYSVREDGTLVVTNKHSNDTTSVTAVKVWDDDDNRDGVRPDHVTLQLKANGEDCGEAVPVSANDNWTKTWSDLLKNENGEEIVYTVVETAVDGYETEYSVREDGVLVVTNKHTLDTTSVTAVKVWDDDDNRDGVRPDHVTLQLKANGEDCGEAVPVSANDNWTKTWSDLLKNDNGEQIVYTVVETAVDGYETEYSVREDGTLVVTNKHENETTSVTAVKVWDDDDNRDGVRPDHVTLQLKANGEDCGEAVPVSASDDWTKTWSDLLKNENGEQIVYTVVETAVDGYETEYSVRDDGTLVVTNKHTLETTSVTAVKVWVDEDDRDGARPESITLQLKANGEDCGEAVPVSANDDWTKTWSDLLKNENGEQIVYTVVETAVDGYETEYSVRDDGTLVVTNEHECALTDIIVTKTWEDDNNRDGIRPESILVQLKANGVEYGEPVEITAEDDWTYTWHDMYVYENGELIVYTAEEVEVDGYSASYSDSGLEITNTHECEKVEVTLTKVWDDDDDKDGLRPDTASFQLYANGVEYGEPVVLGHPAEEEEPVEPVEPGIEIFAVEGEEESDEEPEEGEETDPAWTYVWSDLYKYENGVEIVYTVEEVEVPEGYTATAEYDGYNVTITNFHVPKTGDESNTALWATVFGLSAAGIVEMLRRKKRSEV